MRFKLLFFLAVSVIGFVLMPVFAYAQTVPPALPVEKGVTISVEVTAPSLSYATVVFKGKAYPSAFITILKDGLVTATCVAGSDGDFQKTLTGLSGGIYTFGIWVEDAKERKSITLNFTVTLTSGATTTISGIFLPPTIEINKTKLKQGESFEYNGQAYPSSEITIFIDPGSITKNTFATDKGNWQYLFSTSSLEIGDYTTKAKAQAGSGEQSAFSEIFSFEITYFCSGTDLNNDGKINLADFSILLYWWGGDNKYADQNNDGTVNLIDFSIMLYYWTG